MVKESVLYELMVVRMNDVMNGITNSDGEYREIVRKSNVYSDGLDQMELLKEVWLLFDNYVSEQNALDSRYWLLAYLLGFSDRKAMFLGKFLPMETEKMVSEVWPQKCRTRRKGYC